MTHVNPIPAPGQPITIWTKSYAIGLLERVVATLLQIAIGFGVAFLGNGSTFVLWDWRNTLVSIAVGAGLALLKGILANLLTKDGPSLTHAEQIVPPLPNVAQA